MSIIEERLAKLEDAAAKYLKDTMGRNLIASTIAPGCGVVKSRPEGLYLKCGTTNYFLSREGEAYVQPDRPATGFLHAANPDLMQELYADIGPLSSYTAESRRRAAMTQEQRDREDKLADETWNLQHGGGK